VGGAIARRAETIAREDSAIREFARLIPHVRSLGRRYAGGALLLLATNALALLIPWYMKLAVEALQSPARARFSAAACAMVIVALAAANCITRIYSRTLILNAARIIEYRIREELFQRLLLLDIPFFSGSRTGDILSRFSNDLTNVRMLSGFGAMSAVNTLILYGSAVTLMWRIHPWLTLCAVAPFPLMVLVVKVVSRSMFRRSLAAQEELARLSCLAEESISAVRLVKSYCREEHFQGMFHDIAGNYLEHNLAMGRLRGLIIPVMAMATGAGTLIVLFLGGRLVIGGAITLGDFVAFSGYLAMLVWPTAIMGWILTMLQRGASSMSRLNSLLDAEPAVADAADAAPIEEVREGIEFRNLTFGYDDGRLLDGISCRIAAGERIGITGEVGSGKSSLLRLIPRLLPVEDGMILIDGRDINHVTLDSLRSLIGYVPQEAFLFSRSIRENIAYGMDDRWIDVGDAARRAGFTDDVNSFRDGLETLVGEKGVSLSGGQKQRLSIARALLTGPRILLLDDPLSAVDAGREEEVLHELSGFYGDRTVLIVSHRLSVFRDCHRILVLKDGRIAEQGSPEELLAKNGLYAGMERMQRLREEFL
jgi:ATP-binding cassette subfamily B protein